MKRLHREDLFCWSAFNERLNIDFNSFVWLREGGMLMVSASPAQDAAVEHAVAAAAEVGVPEQAVALDADGVAARVRSPVFRRGVFFPDGATVLVARVNGSEQRINCARGTWAKGRAAWGRLQEQPAAASGAWTGDDTFTAKLCFTETPFAVTLRLKLSGDEVRCETETNVGFGPTKEAPLMGKAK